jgi:hypothetical protein
MVLRGNLHTRRVAQHISMLSWVCLSVSMQLWYGHVQGGGSVGSRLLAGALLHYIKCGLVAALQL